MNKRTARILRTLCLEFFLLLGKIVVLSALFIAVAYVSFFILWDNTSDIARVIVLFAFALYWFVAFVVVVWIPLHMYVYSRFSKITKRRLKLTLSLLLFIAAFILFVYPIRESHTFEAAGGNYVIETRDTLWNKLFQGKHKLPQMLFQNIGVTVFTASGHRLGSFSVNGAYHYTKPRLLIGEDQRWYTEDGGKRIYLNDRP